ncbi:NACHT, LRR and PYD domains-containing protein 3-like isoform X2 [Pseudophryne corroboree]|uniref:NACHT, LRR and PYD domains-containing protein 3-like isoform X2 n=1 Tax=Pseudophryne corroboree TaxID=495146 RepID=UPI0030813AFC
MAASSFKRSPCEGSRTPGDILYESLEDLMQYDFTRFKDKLCDFSYEERPAILRGQLEGADRVTTKSLLLDVYGEETALYVAIEVLKLISLMGPAETLQHDVTQYLILQAMSSAITLEDWRIKYANDMVNEYQRIEDSNARIGEAFNMKKRYTSLFLVKNHRDEAERQHEITSTGQRHLQLMAKRSSEDYSPTTVQALFQPHDNGIIPKIVVLQGPAGIGKTMTSQKIMLDWASGNLYKDKFHFAFYVNCREVNTITCKISLAGYLSRFCGLKCSSDLLQSIFSDSERILLIVDGFDELKLASMKDTEVCDDPFQEVSKEVLLNSLFRKKLLVDSSLIITTRSSSLMKLKGFVQSPRYVEILGFTRTQREEYFYNFFETKEQADLALSAIKDNNTLFTLCIVPVTCWIICTIIKQQLRGGSHVINSRTTTSIYLLYLKGLIKYHGRNSAQPISACIRKLCALANEGVWDRTILFEESDLERHGLSMSELESVFLNESIFHRDVDIHTCYSFIHLSVQEFFAALYYVLDEKSETATKVTELLKASEDQAHLTLTVRFLFGLSSEKQIQEAQRTIGCPLSFGDKSILEEWLKIRPSFFHNETLSCLYETQDEDYVGRMMSHFPDVEIKGLYGEESDQENIGYRAVAYCLGRSTNKYTVSFHDYIIGPNARDVLAPALSKSSKLRFARCRFPDKEEDGFEAGSNFSGLFKQCQIEELEIHDCGLTSSCCDNLSSILTTNRCLVRMELTWNNLEDGVKPLCDGLRHPDCNLQTLALQSCDLTSSSCYTLHSAIATNRTLITLDLTENNLQDSGMRLLCEGLRHPDCILQELRLGNCDLTSSCCADLRSVLITHHSLITLDLSNNDLEDSGIKLLCEGLRHPACNLREIWLCGCGLTSSGCDDLHSVITTSRSLISLNLSVNDLQDCGMKYLCKGLRHPDCILQELALWGCGLTVSCCDDLLSTLLTNRSLIRLDLRGNHLEEAEGKLAEGVRPPLQLVLHD